MNFKGYAFLYALGFLSLIGAFMHTTHGDALANDDKPKIFENLSYKCIMSWDNDAGSYGGNSGIGFEVRGAACKKIAIDLVVSLHQEHSQRFSHNIDTQTEYGFVHYFVYDKYGTKIDEKYVFAVPYGPQGICVEPDKDDFDLDQISCGGITRYKVVILDDRRIAAAIRKL